MPSDGTDATMDETTRRYARETDGRETVHLCNKGTGGNGRRPLFEWLDSVSTKRPIPCVNYDLDPRENVRKLPSRDEARDARPFVRFVA